MKFQCLAKTLIGANTFGFLKSFKTDTRTMDSFVYVSYIGLFVGNLQTSYVCNGDEFLNLGKFVSSQNI